MLLVLDYLRARLGVDERGASLVEYALLLALIATICIAAVALLGSKAQVPYSQVSGSLTSGS